ncbi:AmmeMemoRadiSam system protein B, partial [Patescibacteria group bacterium]|nr:AmmeMemoRadiSam system protein B [Patescibacteria group bacterium]
HLVVADEIAKVFETIGSREADTVIILSPNHFAQGISPLQTTYGSWETYYGSVEAGSDIIDELTGEIEVLRIEDNTFENEHGVSSIVPFVAKSFPDAKLVPLVIDESLSSEDCIALVQAIQKHAPDAVVIASIDMSHYMPLYAQEFHDEITLRALESASTQDIALEIDANAVLDVLMRINEARVTQDWQISYHDSSIQEGLTDDYLENTSHILGFFTAGNPTFDDFASLHFVGDIMLDREVRALIDENGQDYPWEKMDRFLDGVHVTIGNLEGTVNELVSTYTANPPFRFVFSPESVIKMHEFIDIVSLANNHASDVGTAGVQETKDRLDAMEIDWFGSYSTSVPSLDKDVNGIPLTFIGYHQFASDPDDLVSLIQDADLRGRFVIVMPHWGNEYQVRPSSSQRVLAQTMIDAGADLIIGGHPHVAQGIEMIGDVPVVYSLGNFIFDQVDPVTYPALTAGVIITQDSIEIYLMPVWTQGSQPTPMSDIESANFLSNLATYSSESIMTEVQMGVIKVLKTGY